MANSYMNAEQTFHKLLHENWHGVFVIRNHFPTKQEEYKETIKWGEWCKQTIGCMYGHYDYMSYCGPEDGRWFGCRTEEEVQTVTGISYAMAFKNPEDLLLFKLTFGIP